MTQKTNNLIADPGSFRDPSGRVYQWGDRIIRGLDSAALEDYEKLSNEKFFIRTIEKEKIIATKPVTSEELSECKNFTGNDTWAGFVEHEKIPFISYPYEWSFSMLRDAALLQLDVIERAYHAGWSLKDATPYNIQWRGTKPVFIDTPSFQQRVEGEQWGGYRQFCMLILNPLMIKAHLDISHNDLLRASLDGLTPPEAARYFRGFSRLKKGVLTNVFFPAMIENSISKRERDAVPAKKRTGGSHSDAMVIGLIQQMKRLVASLKHPIEHTDWSRYENTHSYQDDDFKDKEEFVRRHAGTRHRSTIWDIGCNTGHFSKISSEFADHVISIDGDHDAIEQLYQREKQQENSNILPLNLNLANLSPAQGWAHKERRAFDDRSKPESILCLALIHHIRLSANIPCALFLDWLHSLQSEVIIEFVDRTDDMVIKLLSNKKEQYEDYSLDIFESQVKERFEIIDQRDLKGGTRRIYMLQPK